MSSEANAAVAALQNALELENPGQQEDVVLIEDHSGGMRELYCRLPIFSNVGSLDLIDFDTVLDVNTVPPTAGPSAAPTPIHSGKR
jgi:hypothetical protein